MASSLDPALVSQVTPDAIRADIEQAGESLLRLGILIGKYGVQCPVDPSDAAEAKKYLLQHVQLMEQMHTGHNDSEVENNTLRSPLGQDDMDLRDEIAGHLRREMDKEEKLRKQCSAIFKEAEENLSNVDQLLKCQLNLHCKDYMTELQSRQRSLKGPLRLLVAGVVNAGKSSLFNLLLGGPYLPVERGPTTTLFCEVTNSDQRSVEVVIHGKPKRTVSWSLDGDPKSKSWHKVRTYILGKPTFHNGEKRHAASLSIKWPFPFLEKNEAITFVDSAGLFGDEGSLAKLANILENIDGFLFILNVTDGTGLEKDRIIPFMKIVKEANEERNSFFLPHNCMFVCNKVDQVPPAERDTVVKAVYEALLDIWPHVNRSQLVPCDVSRKAMAELNDKSFSSKFEEIYRAVCRCIQTSKRHKTEINCYWLDFQILEKVLALSKNIEAFDDYERSKKDQILVHLQTDVSLICETERKVSEIGQRMEEEQRRAIDKLCEILKVTLLESRVKARIWTNDQIPFRNQNEDWLDYKLRLKKKIINRIEEFVSTNPDLQDVREELIVSTSQRLREVRALHTELQRSVSQEMSVFDRKAFTKCTEGPNRKLNVLLAAGMLLLMPISPIVLGVFALYEIISTSSQQNDEDAFDADHVAYMEEQSELIINNAINNKLSCLAEERMDHITSNSRTMTQFYNANINHLRTSIDQLRRALNEKRKPIDKQLLGDLLHISDSLKRFVISEVSESSIDPRHVNMSTSIGKGAFGTVHKATLKAGETHTDIAVKMIYTPASDDQIGPDDPFIYILRELSSLRMLTLKTHGQPDMENFIKYFGYHTDQNDGIFTLRLYMEKCDWSLADIINRSLVRLPHKGPLVEFPCNSGPGGRGWTYVINLALQCTKGLDFLHQNEVIHRDVKPSNFLVKETADRHVVKIADLGQARNASLVATLGRDVGTLLYNPPEVLEGGLHTKSSDVHSLALVFWELWHGCKVFNEIPNDKLFKSDRPTPKFTNIKPPESLKTLMQRAFGRSVTNRPSTKDFIDSLHSLSCL